MSSLIKLCTSFVSRPNPMMTYSRTSLQRRLCSSVKESGGSSAHTQPHATHKVNDFERKILVWTKKYKTAEEVPSMINQEVMERARNRFRIKIANWMMAATAFGCILMIYSGKKAAERGESVSKYNLDWHKEYNAKAEKTEKDYATKFEKMAQQGADASKAASN